MKTPIERITEYINNPETKTRNPICMLKELRARITQDDSNRLEPPVILEIAEEKQNTHNMDIIHLGCCTKCGGINFTNKNCKWWDSNLSK